MVENPLRICELLVGLGEVEVLGVDDEVAGSLVVHLDRGRDRGQLLDIVPGRDAQAPMSWLLDQPQW